MAVILVILGLYRALDFKALNSPQISPHLNYILQWETAVSRNLLFLKDHSLWLLKSLCSLEFILVCYVYSQN